MSRTPPPRAPAYPGLTNGALNRITSCYAQVYAACAGFGMKREACREYAADAVDGMTSKVLMIEEGFKR